MSNGICETSFTIKWRIKVPVGPEGRIVEASQKSSTRSWNVSWENVPVRNGVQITVLSPWPTSISKKTLALPRPVNLYIAAAGCTSSFKSIIHLLSHSSEFFIPWADIMQLLSSGNTVVDVCIIGSEGESWDEVSHGIKAPSIHNFLPFSKMMGALDEPFNHDVVFHFSGGRCLYADTMVLRSKSPYFARLMHRGGSQKPSSDSVATPGAQSLIYEDSDMDTDDDEAKGGRSQESLATESATSAAPSEPLSKKRKLKLSSTQEENTMLSIFISDASYRTVRAILYYLYSEYIVFAPLSSYFTEKNYPGRSRKDWIGGYLEENPTYPAPVSSKSVYTLATRYQIPTLQVAAIHHFNLYLGQDNVSTELFGDFCRLHELPRTLAIECAIKNWGSVRGSKQWVDAAQEAKVKLDPYYVEISSNIMNSLH